MKKVLCITAILLLAVVSYANQAESELNDTMGTADGPIAFNETLTGNLQNDTASCQDYWRFTGESGSSYTFTGNPKNTLPMSPLDIGLAIENSGGTEIAVADANGGNQSEVLNWTCPSDGTYYIIMYEATATPNGIATYEIICEKSSGVDDWELY
jgi:pre-peptidase